MLTWQLPLLLLLHCSLRSVMLPAASVGAASLLEANVANPARLHASSSVCLMHCAGVWQLEEARGRLEEARQATQAEADQVRQVMAQLEETHQRLVEEIDARKALTAEASVKAARLARLEGRSSSAQQTRASAMQFL